MGNTNFAANMDPDSSKKSANEESGKIDNCSHSSNEDIKSSGGSSVSANGGSVSANGGSVSSNGGPLPSKGGSVSSNDVSVSPNESSKSANGISPSANGVSRSANGVSQSANRVSQSANEMSASSNESSQSSNGFSLSSNDSSLSSNRLSLSSNELPKVKNELSVSPLNNLLKTEDNMNQASENFSLKTYLLNLSGSDSLSADDLIIRFNDSISFALDNTGNISSYLLPDKYDFYYNRKDRRSAENIIREVKNSLSIIKNVCPLGPEEYLLILRILNKEIKKDFETLPAIVKLENVFIVASRLGNFTYPDLRKIFCYSEQTLYRITAYMKSRGWLKLHNTAKEKYFFITEAGKALLKDALSELPAP